MEQNNEQWKRTIDGKLIVFTVFSFITICVAVGTIVYCTNDWNNRIPLFAACIINLVLQALDILFVAMKSFLEYMYC